MFKDLIFDCVVPVECVNICKFAKGDLNRKYDFCIYSCAWRAPRALKGFLTSTENPLQCFKPYGNFGRQGRFQVCVVILSDLYVVFLEVLYAN